MLKVLLVEDNLINVKLVEEALKKINHSISFEAVYDGKQAIAFLKKESPFTGLFTPDIVLLDKNMPIMDGFEFLSIIKQDYKFSKIPILMFTTSTNPLDIENSYQLGANSYFVKPIEFNEFVSLLDKIISYWQDAKFSQ